MLTTTALKHSLETQNISAPMVSPLQQLYVMFTVFADSVMLHVHVYCIAA